MTDEVTRHYESLLAPNYTWMFGVSFDAKVAEQRNLLERLLAADAPRAGLAVDLGSGPGYQSIALADLGFSPVLALDLSKTLLEELDQHRGGRPIQPVCADLRELASHVRPGHAQVVVCMGDTLTHLPGRDSVAQLFRDARATLVPGGLIVLTFRDLSVELLGLERVIPVRSDPDRIMTCFLEFGPDTVTVHDLVHIRESAGWKLEKSSYKKLRLSPADVASSLRESGFEVLRSEPAGRMHAIVARR